MRTDQDAKRNEQVLSSLLKDEENRKCADCGQKGTRWASWNIGVFLCIRCGGLHRKLGTHISKVKSVTLDSWTNEEVKSMQEKGNARINAIFNPDPSRHPFPSFAGDMEQYIRDKYERKLFTGTSGRNLPTHESAPMSLGTMAKMSFERKDVKDFSKELKQLQEMGFNDKNACLNALNSSNGNISSCIDSLASKSQKSDPYNDLLGISLSELSISKSKATPIENEDNDWGDLEFASSPSIQTSPTEAKEDLLSKPTPTSPGRQDAPSSEQSAGTQNASNPWTTQTSDLGSVLGKSNFYADDDDPFKDLTHNPFK